jgi:hypothetical protein
MREATRSDARHMGVRGCASVTQAMRQTPRTMATTLASFLSRIKLFRLLVVAVSQYFLGLAWGHNTHTPVGMGASSSRPLSKARLPASMVNKEYVGDATHTSGAVDAEGKIVTMTSKNRAIRVWRTGNMIRYVFTGVVGQAPPATLVVNHGVVINERHAQFRNKDMSLENWFVQKDGSIRSVYQTQAQSWETVFR